MRRFVLISFYSVIILILSACGGGNTTSGQDQDYDTMKKMMVDILQTEDGRKALIEILNDDNMQQQLVIESEVVKQSINETLASEQGSDMWTSLFKDPTFVEGFAQSMEKEHIEMMKNLMNDSEFQKQMLELLQNPEITTQMLTLLKSQQFRAHLEETIQQTLDTPLFQAKMTEILLKAAEKQSQQQKSDQEGDGESGDQQGEGGGDSGQGGGGGGGGG